MRASIGLVGVWLGCGLAACGSSEQPCVEAAAHLQQCFMSEQLASPPGQCTPSRARALLALDCDQLRQQAVGKGDGLLCEWLGIDCPASTIHVDDLADGSQGSGTADDPYRDLQLAIDRAPPGATLVIHPGRYEATPVPYHDPSCGNFEGDCSAEATRGFLIEAKALHLVGAGPSETELWTNAGYGVLFEWARKSSIRSLRVTGGRRDTDDAATDAGIVARYSELLVEDVRVSDNDDRADGVTVGIGGIFGREGASLTVRDSVIENNSWDGITLYQGPWYGRASAHVEGCRIGCTSRCQFRRGRGVGIAATWNSRLTATGNVVHHYWKGIGSFGEATLLASNNTVRDQYGWGIVASGQSTMHAHNNVVVRNGTTGMASWTSKVSGSFVNNIVVGNGTANKEWVGKKTGVWLNASTRQLLFVFNLVHGNAAHDVCSGGIPEEKACSPLVFDGIAGNLALEPRFVSMEEDDFRLDSDSPAIDRGDPAIIDVDGSRSDLGAFGGPDARDSLP